MPNSVCQEPVKVGVVLSGGQVGTLISKPTPSKFLNCRCPLLQASGGHNVIAGIFDGIKAWNKVGPWDGERCIYCYLKAICSSSHLGLSQSSLHVESVILLVWHIFYPIA